MQLTTLYMDVLVCIDWLHSLVGKAMFPLPHKVRRFPQCICRMWTWSVILLMLSFPLHSIAQSRTSNPVVLFDSDSRAAELPQLDAAEQGYARSVLRQGGLRADAQALLSLFRSELPELGPRGPQGTSVRLRPDLPPVTMRLFPDTVFTFIPDRVVHRTQNRSAFAPGTGQGRILRGYLIAGGEGSVILSEFEGAISGAVRLTSGEYYEIEIRPGRSAEIRQLGQNGWTDGRDEVVIPDLRDDAEAGLARRQPVLLEEARSRFATVEQFVTVTMFYTKRVLQTQGGIEGLLAFAGRVEEESNEVLRNSELPIEYRFVASQVIDFDDTRLQMSYLQALFELEEVHGTMERTRSRLATFFVDPPIPSAGQGYTLGIAFLRTPLTTPQRHSVVHQRFAGGPEYVFAHEAGHNLGCVHDAVNGGQDGGLFGDSRGYQQTAVQPFFHTVMAYPCSGCRLVPYYSEPNLLYQTIPLGKEGTRCAATIAQEVAATVEPLPGTNLGCHTDVFPSSYRAASNAHDAYFSVTTEPECEWRVSGLSDGIPIQDLDAGNPRKGSGLLRLRIAASTESFERNASVRVGNSVLPISQSGAQTPLMTIKSVRGELVFEASSTPDSPQEICDEVSVVGSSVSSNQALGVMQERLPAWIRLNAETSVDRIRYCLTVDPSGLAAGTHREVLPFRLGGLPRQRLDATVPIEVRVREGVQPVRYAPRALSFAWNPSEPTPGPQRVELSVPQGVVLLPMSNPRPWLQVASTASAGGLVLAVSVRPQVASAGRHESAIRVGCPDGSCGARVIPVQLEVTASPANPESPLVASGGVVNAASFAPGLSEGSWMSVFGKNLATTTRGWEERDFAGDLLPTRLDDVRVLVDGKSAAISFISPGQINFQCPGLEREGWVTVEVVTPGGRHSMHAWAETSNPGVFLYGTDGEVAALHSDAMPAAKPGGLGPGVTVRPARPGDILAMYGTGLGRTQPPVPAGTLFAGAAALPESAYFRVVVGGTEAEVLFAGQSGAGLNQVNFRVPALPAGDHLVQMYRGATPTPWRGTLRVQGGAE